MEPMKAGHDKDRHIDDVPARQYLRQAEEFRKFRLRELAAAHHQRPVRPRQDAAEPRERYFQKASKELPKRRLHASTVAVRLRCSPTVRDALRLQSRTGPVVAQAPRFGGGDL
jgi:hypothetical protein